MASSNNAQRSMESRVGRNKQRYNDNGDRLVAGVVPVSKDREFVLLIQSTRRKGWVLPKGGWESDEQCDEAARREAWEEAGIVIEIDLDLGEIQETRPPKLSSQGQAAPRCVYRFFEATVSKEEEQWPEQHKRLRKWMTYHQAWDALSARPELQMALQRSSLKRGSAGLDEAMAEGHAEVAPCSSPLASSS